ncbi:MAG: aminotransferase class V-fold PLP-dependent enzyme [Planctomycetota bacterium]|nr:MAG: aminotransferase class V-fold PLP-dependent enzyme [Planctomycetota bacterium]
MPSDPSSDMLAIHGGPRALGRERFKWPPPDDGVRAALLSAWDDGSWGRYHAEHTGRLEEQLARMHDVELASLCCSGTFAVELALRGLGIGAGDEVILAGYDFAGNFRAIEAVGAVPVLVDVVADGWLLDVDQLEQAASEATLAVIVSHLHGGLADMSRIMKLARRLGLAVVEDACQAPGASVGGRVAGSWGDVGVLSFGGSKLLTAGRGGAIVTRAADVHQRAKIFCQRGNHAFPLSELQAAVLLPQLALLLERNQRRREAIARLLEQTAGLPGLRPQSDGAADAAPSYYKMAWRYVPEELGGHSIEQFVVAARAEGLPLDTGFRGFVRRGAKRCRKLGDLPHTRRAAEGTVLLHHPILLEADETIDALARGMAKVARAFAAVDRPDSTNQETP